MLWFQWVKLPDLELKMNKKWVFSLESGKHNHHSWFYDESEKFYYISVKFYNKAKSNPEELLYIFSALRTYIYIKYEWYFPRGHSEFKSFLYFIHSFKINQNSLQSLQGRPNITKFLTDTNLVYFLLLHLNIYILLWTTKKLQIIYVQILVYDHFPKGSKEKGITQK